MKSTKCLLFFFIILLTQIVDVSSNNVQLQIMKDTQIVQKSLLSAQTGYLDKDKAKKQYRAEIAAAQQENAKIPKKDNAVFRVMTYNVHYWRDPEDTKDGGAAMNQMIQVIKTINPDMLILQEASPDVGHGQTGEFRNSRAMKLLKENAGFVYFFSCNTLSGGQWFGNVIGTKTPHIDPRDFHFEAQLGNEKRCFVGLHMEMPNKKIVHAYGTHLEVKGTDDIRIKQISQIVNFIINRLPGENVFIAADFNATRESAVIKFLQNNGFKDCFSYLGWQHPYYTNWTGKEIDFIFLSPSWNLPLAGCYVYYDAASDHMPVIMDIQMAKPQQQPSTTGTTTQKPQDLSPLNNALIQLQKMLDNLQKSLSNLV